MLLLALLFGLGTGLFFLGAFSGRKNRFVRSRSVQKDNLILNLFRPLAYLWPLRPLLARSKASGAAQMEELLERAGNPWGLKARDILMLRVLLPGLVLLAAAVFYGLLVLAGFVRNIFAETGLVCSGLPLGPAALLSGLALASAMIPQLVLRCLAKSREIKTAAEQGLFSEIVFMCLKARLNLQEALAEAAKTTEYLRPYLQVCLNGWPTDRVRALENLKKDVGSPGFRVIVDLLAQVAEVGDERIAEFIEKNRKIEEEVRSINISARSKVRPLLLTLQMFLPFVLILIVLFYPLISQVERLLYSF